MRGLLDAWRRRHVSLALQGGFRHESNGEDGADSRSINSIYVAPMAAVPLGGDRRVLIAPRLIFYVGDKSSNPDIVRYRGNTSLFLQIGDGVAQRMRRVEHDPPT